MWIAGCIPNRENKGERDNEGEHEEMVRKHSFLMF